MVIRGQSNKVYEKLHIVSDSGDCVQIIDSTNITIQNSEIGPCDGNGISISGGSGHKVYDNYIHPEKPASDCCDTHDGVVTSDTSDITIQGNVIAFSESNVEPQTGSDHVSVIGNFLLNPRGPYPRGQNFQAAEATNLLVQGNYALSSTDSKKYPYPEVQEDSINFWRSDDFIVTGNYITGGHSPSGCGAIADDSSNRGQFLKNILVDTGQCGISIADGNDQVVDGNKILNRTPVDGGGNTALVVWEQYSQQCGPVTVSNNIAYEIKPDGSLSGYWDGGGCEPVTESNNVWDEDAYNALTPVAQKIPPPLIPPQPKNCVVNSPYSTQNSLPRCS